MKSKKKLRILYSRETLKEAMAAIHAGMPINTASNKYLIPRSTLQSKKVGKYADKRPGPDTVLTTTEETSLVQWIISCSKCGMPVGKQHLLNSVALMVKLLNRENPFANGRPGRHWYQGFLRRHESVAEKIAENTSIVRTAACEAGIRKWFSVVESYLKERELLNVEPSRIFSMDTIMLEYPETDKFSKNLSVHIVANASGELATPMVVYNYQRMPEKVYENLSQLWFCRKSDSEGMTPENLFDYVTKCFYPWLVERQVKFPVLLFLDGKVPNLTLTLSDFCWKNKIELVALQPNASFVLQPLEVKLFPLLKHAWQEALRRCCKKTKTVNLLKEQIASLLKSIIDGFDLVKILKEGFQNSGLHPWSEKVINYEKIPKRELEKVPTERIEYTPYVPESTPSLEVQEFVKDSGVTTEFLQYIEQLLDSDTLQAFKNVEEYDDWTGKLEDTGLFYFWRKIVNLCKTDQMELDQNTVSTIYTTESVSITLYNYYIFLF